MPTLTITIKNIPYTCNIYNNIHPTNIFIESPITGEFLEVKPPFTLEKYTTLLTTHITREA